MSAGQAFWHGATGSPAPRPASSQARYQISPKAQRRNRCPGVGQGHPCRVPTDPLPVDLPEEAVALVHPADAANAPLLLPLAFDLAQEAILVPELKKVFRPEEIHNLAILQQLLIQKQDKEMSEYGKRGML